MFQFISQSNHQVCLAHGLSGVDRPVVALHDPQDQWVDVLQWQALVMRAKCFAIHLKQECAKRFAAGFCEIFTVNLPGSQRDVMSWSYLAVKIFPQSGIISFGHGVAPLGYVRTPNVAGNTMAFYNAGGVA